MDNQSFIHAIQACPNDEIPRLVYADWLDDQGDPRGELIRVQCEIIRSPQNDLGRKRLEERAEELLEDYGETWLEPLRDLGAIGVSARCFQRGLLERIKISAEDFLMNAETLCQIEPAFTCVQLTNVSPHLKSLAEQPIPAQITELDLSVNRLISYECQVLAGAIFSRQLTALDLKFNPLENEGVAELCLGTWPKLKRLDLSSCRIGSEGAIALANQSAFPQLNVLILSMNRIQDQGARAFFGSSSRQELEELHLASNGIGNEAGGLMLNSEGLPALRVLNLRYNRLAIETQKQLMESPLSRRLERLDLTGNIRPSSYQ